MASTPGPPPPATPATTPATSAVTGAPRPTPALPAADGEPAPVTARQAEKVRQSGPPTISVPIPWIGTVRISRPELAYVGGILGLSALGLLEWPIALVIASGHVLAADRSSQTVQELGDAMTEA